MSLGPTSPFLLCICATGLAACGDATGPGPVQEIELLIDVSDDLELPSAPVAGLPVAIGLFLTVPAASSHPPIAPATVTARARRLLEDTNQILAQCELHLVAEAAQVIVVPPRLAFVDGNELGSWGGHPPESEGDPDVFTYHENERLTSDTHELFSWGKRHTSRNAIGIFVVQDIVYFIGQQQTPAGGLSFPPVAYHHADDYPLRNSVLVKMDGRDPNRLPLASGLVVAHELGHMLLNTGDHVADGAASGYEAFGNLMLSGSAALLTPGQCDRMHSNRARLYGDEAVPDPGAPSTG